MIRKSEKEKGRWEKWQSARRWKCDDEMFKNRPCRKMAMKKQRKWSGVEDIATKTAAEEEMEKNIWQVGDSSQEMEGEHWWRRTLEGGDGDRKVPMDICKSSADENTVMKKHWPKIDDEEMTSMRKQLNYGDEVKCDERVTTTRWWQKRLLRNEANCRRPKKWGQKPVMEKWRRWSSDEEMRRIYGLE